MREPDVMPDVTNNVRRRSGVARGEAGFTLIETMVSLGLLTTGMLSLAAVMSLGLRQMSTSSADVVMVQKATEAIENVFTARDARILTWSQIRNVEDGGIFLDGSQALRDPGADGLINTSDDGDLEQAELPGRDNLLGTDDDEVVRLDTYTREIEITDLSPGLRQIRVIIRYGAGESTTEYVLTTYVSTYA